jgi:hypothetical protein
LLTFKAYPDSLDLSINSDLTVLRAIATEDFTANSAVVSSEPPVKSPIAFCAIWGLGIRDPLKRVDLNKRRLLKLHLFVILLVLLKL